MKRILSILTLTLGLLPLGAHADDASQTAKKAVQVAKEGAQKAGAAIQDAANAAAQVPGSVVPAGSGSPLQRVLDNAPRHMHSKLVHFPVALGTFGLLFLLLALKWPNYLAAARLSLMTALVTGAGGLVTGEAMEEYFESGPKAEVFEWHERFAQGSMALFALALLLSFMPSLRKAWWPVALIGIAVVLLTGGLGGVLAHTR